MVSVHDFLLYTVEMKGSDLHVRPGGPPFVRINGHLHRTDFPVLTAADCERAAMELMNDDQARQFKQKGEADFAYSEHGLGRFRINVFRQRGSVALACRRVLPGSPSFETLGLPPSVKLLSQEQRGLVLVTGPTSSGKTTTTAAMIDHINAHRSCHVLTIEDPIEILHPDRTAIVNQREIGQDTQDFAVALRAAMRQDPDVIFVGEIRDPETVKAALQAAETGHLVISTLHTTNATETVNRIVDLFPPHQQHQARMSLANSLKGIVCQRLLPQVGGGRVAAIECLVMTTRLHEFIVDPEKTTQIEDAIVDGAYYGMQTFDAHLLALYRDGRITMRDAMAAATSPHDFRIAVRAAGVR